RNRLHDVVNAMISGQHAHTEKFALLLLDLDNFKFVNDTLGHEAGDFVLRTAAKRIKRMASQAHLVARLGGDEFAILWHNTDRKEIELIAHRVLRALRRRMKDQGKSMESYASTGIACSPEHGTTGGDVFGAAALPLSRPKQPRLNRAVVFVSEMLRDAEKRLGMLRLVRTAIESNQ